MLGPAFQGGSITNLTLTGPRLTGTNTVTGVLTLGNGFSGSLTVASNAVVNVLAGTSGGPLLVSTGATVNWTGGDIGNSGGWVTVMSNGVLNLSGSADKQLLGPLTNAGTVVWSGSGNWNVNLCFGGVIYNLAGGLFDIQNDQSVVSWCGAGGFSNAGTVRKSAGSGTTQIGLQFDNTGMVEADIGIIAFQAGYSNSSSANLATSLGSSTPGSGYGQIQFSSAPTFDGTFSVSTRNGYRPNAGDSFDVLSYPSAAGDFACMNGLDLGIGLRLEPRFSTSELTLTTITYTTNALPSLVIYPVVSGVLVAWPVDFNGWDLYATTNLATPLWSPVPVVGINNTVLPISCPQGYFRLSKSN